MTGTTTRFGFPELSGSQAQKDITHNEALIRLDAVISAVAFGFAEAPLGTETDGAAYIVSTGTGTFDGWDDSLAYLLDGIWAPVAPADGMLVWVTSGRGLVVFQGSLGGWRPVTRARPLSGLFCVATTGSDDNVDDVDVTALEAVTFTNSSSHIGWTAHGMSVGNVVLFQNLGGSLPTNFSAVLQLYYVKTVVDADTIIVSNTAGGTAITAGSAGSGSQFGYKAKPFATINHALSVLNDLDCAGAAIEIVVADGAYSETVNIDHLPLGTDVMTILGNLVTPDNVTGINFEVGGDARVRITGFQTTGISIREGAKVDLSGSNMSWIGSGPHLTTINQSSVDTTAMTEKITGNFNYHLFAIGQSEIVYAPDDLTIVGTPTIDTFAQAYLGGLIDANGWRGTATVTGGPCTGKKADSSANSTITTGGDDFPATVAATVSPESYYD